MPPEVDLTTEEHRLLFRSYVDDAMHAQISDEQWEGMVRAQATTDKRKPWFS